MHAWPVVSALPQWIGCNGKEKEMLKLLDVLAVLFAQAIPKVSVQHLRDICVEVERMVSFQGETDVEVKCQKMANAVTLLKSKNLKFPCNMNSASPLCSVNTKHKRM